MLHLASATSLTWYWIWHPLVGPGYQFWSGVASDFGEVTLLGAVIVAYRRINCHSKGCWRVGRHRMVDGKYVLCSHCLKKGDGEPQTVTAAYIHSEHRKHLARLSRTVPSEEN
jgi:hypothetical protein